MKLTGIPHVEREALAKRGEAYAAYQREVPIFFPRLFN
jgi:steroid 5-alpha reductase family enzyme